MHTALLQLTSRGTLRLINQRRLRARHMAHPNQMAAAQAVPDLSKIRGVLFDIDGTLTNSDPLHFKAFQQMLQEVGFQNGVVIDETFYRAHISGRHNPEIAADLFPDWPEEKRVAFYEEKEQRFRNNAGALLQRMPGLTEFLAWVDRRGLRKAAVTNAPRDNAELMLSALQLDKYFEILVLGEECARAKPYPDPYLTALERLGLQPNEAVVIEDSPSGIRAAVAAGVPVFGIPSGQDESVLLAAGVCAVIQDFNALLALANRHCSQGSGSQQMQGQQQQQQRQQQEQPQGAKDVVAANVVAVTADSR